MDNTHKNNSPDTTGVLTKHDVDLSHIVYSRTGDRVKRCHYPGDIGAFCSLVQSLKSNNRSFRVFGNTTNVLFLDCVTYSDIIFTNFLSRVRFDGQKVTVEAGRDVAAFCRDLAMRKLSGAEGLEGIPGTIGGALMMNAGAYGYTISDHLVEVQVLTPEGSIRRISRDNLVFENRHAPSLEGLIVLSCEFCFPAGDYDVIEKKMRRFHISRHQYQEWVYPNLGSIFIVPSLNIHNSAKQSLKAKGRLLFYFVEILMALWNLKCNFFIRRSFPEFNFEQRLLKYFLGGTYNSSLTSNCTLNTFANKNASTIELLQHIANVSILCGRNLKLENEIVVDAIETINDAESYEHCKNLMAELNASD